MTPEHAFLWSIKESPEDDGLRLIFADWLEENGQPERAEFIRLQVELARRPFLTLRKIELERRANELLAEQGARWLGSWADVGWFEGGRLHIGCELSKLWAAAGGEVSLAWVEGLTLFNADKVDIRACVDSPWLRHITSLDLTPSFIGAEGTAALAASPHLPNLTSLDLGSSDIGNEGAAALAASPHLTKLTDLRLRDNEIGAEGAAAMAVWPHLARLTSLDLGDNHIGDAGAAALAASPHLARLKHLNLARNAIKDSGAARLASSPHVPHLDDFVMNYIEAEGLVLDLDGNNIGDVGAAAFAASPHLANLAHLDLRDNDIGDEGKARLNELYDYRCLF